MRILSLLFVMLLVSQAWSQQNPASPTAPQEPAARGHDDDKEGMPDSAAAIAPDAAVLTIKGLCAGSVGKSAAGSADANCQTVITRAQFERLTTAIHANVPTQRRQFASSYPRLLAMAREAEQRGLDKQQNYEDMIAFARLQILSQELLHSIQDEAAQVSAKDIEDYYRDNPTLFERASLERIMVPDIRQTEPAKNDKGEPAEAPSEEKNREAMKQEAEALRVRAAAGDDFARLQKQAYDFAGLSTPPPATSLLKTRRTSLPAAHQSIFDLKSGEVSAVISDGGGYYIYKLVAKEAVPLSEADAEIHKKLTEQRMRATMQKVQDSVSTDVNQAYFGSGPVKRRHAAPTATPGQAGADPASTPPTKSGAADMQNVAGCGHFSSAHNRDLTIS